MTTQQPSQAEQQKQQPQVPKAILYSWQSSVWATVPLLCLHEKGYSADEYIVKQVDITKGENFSPSYLKINANGTIPTLVVPTLETTGPEVTTKYRSLRDTMTIADFLDGARNVNTQSTTSSLPAPSLRPATIDSKTLSDSLISLVHMPTVDPNFLFLSARTSEELAEKRKNPAGSFIRDRQSALKRYIQEAETIAQEKLQTAGQGADAFEQKTVQFLKEKFAANMLLSDIYEGTAGDETERGFFEAGKKAWTKSLPDVLTELESRIKGVHALGDHVSLADLHIISFLGRLVEISGGSADTEGISAIETQIGTGFKVGEKVRTFWTTWTGRESFQNVFTSVFTSDTI